MGCLTTTTINHNSSHSSNHLPMGLLTILISPFTITINPPPLTGPLTLTPTLMPTPVRLGTRSIAPVPFAGAPLGHL